MAAISMVVNAVFACGDGAWTSADSVDTSVGQVSALETDGGAMAGYQSGSALAAFGATWREFTRSCAGTTREIGNGLKASAGAVRNSDVTSASLFGDYLRGYDPAQTGTTWATGGE